MPDSDRTVVIFGNVRDADMAAEIGSDLLGAGLVAFVSYWAGVTGMSIWAGELHTADEVAIFLVTRASLADAAIAGALKHVPNGTSPFVLVNAAGGDQQFLQWVAGQTRVSP